MKLTKIDSVTLVRLFRNIANCLDNIESFACGYTFQPSNLPDLKYPLLFLETPQQIEYSQTFKKITVGFQVLNKHPEGITGERVSGLYPDMGTFNIINEAEYRTQDVINILYKELKEAVDGWDITMLPILEAYEDRVFGFRVDITFKATNGINYCDEPRLDESCSIIPIQYEPCDVSYNQLLSEEFANLSPVLTYNINPVGTQPLVAVFDFLCDPPTSESDIAISWVDVDGNVLDISVAQYTLGGDRVSIFFNTGSGNWNGHPNSQICVNFNGFPEPACFNIIT